MINNLNIKNPYPVHLLPANLRDFIHCAVGSTKASEELVAPVVLAGTAAAVQGVVDVVAPYGGSMPTSIFFGTVIRSGEHKSSALKTVLTAFEEFEQGILTKAEHGNADQAFNQYQSHPFVIEKSSESGVIDLFRQGAKSIFYALDEGALLLQRMDFPAFCKRFDGGTIRSLSRKEGAIVLPGTRASVCMLIQDATFNRFMSKKGDQMIESGFLPRILMSFATRPPTNNSHYFASPKLLQDPQTHPFHERVRSLLRDYANSLGDPASKHIKLVLDSSAEIAWRNFDDEMDNMLVHDASWEDVRPFVKRAGEHVLRLAAVLQWFSSPQPQVEKWAIDAAVGIVKWHLAEAKMAFGEPPIEVQVQQLAELLYEYLLRMFKAIGQTWFARSDLIRCAPAALRKADQLTMAVHYLIQTNQISIVMLRKKEFIVLNETQRLIWNQLGINNCALYGIGNY